MCRLFCICTDNRLLDDEAQVPRQMLFSWARFMAGGPVKPKTRSRKPQPTTLTMLERAFTWEQEREAETVGAGC